jgi:hypothetical protein
MVITKTISPTDTTSIQKVIDQVGNTPANYTFEEGDYLVNSLLRFYNYTTVTCEPNAVFQLMDNAPVKTFGLQVPCLGSKYKTNITGLDISGMIFRGNRDNQKAKGASTYVAGSDHGKGYGNAFGFGDMNNPVSTNVTNCYFHDMDLGYNSGDEIRIEGGSNIRIKNIKSAYGGHDVVHLNSVTNCEVSDCEVSMSSNNFVRTRSSSTVSIHDNVCHGTQIAYAPGIQVESITANRFSTGIQIYGNYIHDTFGPGIWLAGTIANNRDVSIYNNLIVSCGRMPAANKISGVGGIIAEGFSNVRVLNNTIDSCYGYGMAFTNYQLTGPTGMTAYLKGNIITNTQKAFYPDKNSGTGIGNVSGHYTVTSTGNCLYGNDVANYYKVNASEDLKEDPCFVGNGDYHLKSKGGHFSSSGLVYDSVSSPCIFENFELGRFMGTKEMSVFFPPATHVTPSEIVGDSCAVIILCKTEEAATRLGVALKESAYIGDEKIVVYVPGDV